MRLVSSAFAAALAGGMLLLAVPVAANSYPSHTTETFRDFEHHYSGAERLDVARTALNARVPAGTSVADARAVLREAGATCTAATTCTFNTFDTNHDMRHSVHWTVDLNAQNGAVSALDVRRETLGS